MVIFRILWLKSLSAVSDTIGAGSWPGEAVTEQSIKNLLLSDGILTLAASESPNIQPITFRDSASGRSAIVVLTSRWHRCRHFRRGARFLIRQEIALDKSVYDNVDRVHDDM
jgi:hypothetical protein